ncbi:MAG: 50S ribosomal protein L24 [Chloroflexota bacterium]
MKVKIRKGDTVEVISGGREDKGKRGEVLKVLPEENGIVVQGINIRKKHQRQVQTQGRNLRPGIIEFEAPVSISNVMVICPKCDKPVRVRVQRDEAGQAQRLCRKCNTALD